MCDNAFLPYLSVFLTLLIGAAAAYLGYRQQQTNALRLQHELFERRYKVYDSFMSFISGVRLEDRTSQAACLSFFSKITSPAAYAQAFRYCVITAWRRQL